MDDTIEYLAESFPSLSREQLGELRAIGTRFCSPVIVNAQGEAGTVPEREEGSGEAASAAAA